jgi:hypothetical protein
VPTQTAVLRRLFYVPSFPRTALKGETVMATSPDLPTPITPDPPDVPELPVEPDEGPSAPSEPTDPAKPFSFQPK